MARENRSRILNFRVTAEQEEAIREAAGEVPVSTWLRAVALAVANRKDLLGENDDELAVGHTVAVTVELARERLGQMTPAERAVTKAASRFAEAAEDFARTLASIGAAEPAAVRAALAKLMADEGKRRR